MSKGLPNHILERASLRGNEAAWRIDDIPLVIEAARAANLLNFGGQLQFRVPEGTCECYWVSVCPEVLRNRPWNEMVRHAADESQRLFDELKGRFDFLAEGLNSFAPHLDALKAQGGNPADYMCFVWDALSEEEWHALTR